MNERCIVVKWMVGCLADANCIKYEYFSFKNFLIVGVGGWIFIVQMEESLDEENGKNEILHKHRLRFEEMNHTMIMDWSVNFVRIMGLGDGFLG